MHTQTAVIYLKTQFSPANSI